jgi:hypothetical protein
MIRNRILALLLSMTLLMSLAVPVKAAADDNAADLGIAYYRGTNGEKDYVKAMEYLLKAEQENNPEVLSILGEMYERGLGVKANLIFAVKYYLRAAELGDEQSREKLTHEPLKSVAEAMQVITLATHVTGVIGISEIVHGAAYPLYLDEPLVNAQNLSMVVSVDQYSGWPFGDFDLYGKDSGGEWHDLAGFNIDRSMVDGHYETFNLKFEQPEEAIVALAICPVDENLNYDAKLDVSYIAPGENVGEYSEDIPAPVFTPANMEELADRKREYMVPPVKFSTTDLNGEVWDESRLSDYKLTMISFWSMICNPTVEEIETREKLYEKYKDRGFMLLGATVSNCGSSGIELLNKAGVTYPVLNDNGSLNGLFLNAKCTATTVFLDEKGQPIFMDETDPDHIHTQEYLQKDEQNNWSKQTGLPVFSAYDGALYIGEKSFDEWSEIIDRLFEKIELA